MVRKYGFVSEGVKKELLWLDMAFTKEFSTKTEILGPDEGEVKELRVFNRVARWEMSGIVWEADPRHAEMVVEQLDMLKLKPVTTPGVKEEVKAGTKEERRTNFADADNLECNVFAQEALGNDEIVSLHGWSLNEDGIKEVEFEQAANMQTPAA